MTHLVRATGWVLIAAGAVVLLYLVYQLVFTNTVTNAAQQQLLEQWSPEVEEPVRRLAVTSPRSDDQQPPTPAPTATVPEGDASPAVREADASPNVPEGDAVAVVTFRRPGSDEPLVHDGPLAVVEGVTPDVLKRGPGRYPDTATPGEKGNFAIAGHRTTYGAPFFHVDQLRRGDLIDVTDRDGRQWVYVVRKQQVVQPEDTWTIGPDPLGSGRPTLTLTTCYPRFSNAQRLIVFSELREAS